MNTLRSLLFSPYIIDGARQDSTPFRMLENCGGQCSDPFSACLGQPLEPIIDETSDPLPPEGHIPADEITRWGQALLDDMNRERTAMQGNIASFTVSRIAKSLIDTLWNEGKHLLDDLSVNMEWTWSNRETGDAAAFYKSVEAACEYIDTLGIRIDRYSVREGQEHKISATVNTDAAQGCRCPSESSGKKGNWLIYIPFDPCKYRLGGSLLSEKSGLSGGKSPKVEDADYFMDCFEVVGELVEDGIATAGITIDDGGLMTALMAFGAKGTMDISGIVRSYGEDDIVKILFAEIPGAIIEISDSDYDYVDAELLLQDVAYYPLGQIGEGKIEITADPRSGISGILDSLMSGSIVESED